MMAYIHILQVNFKVDDGAGTKKDADKIRMAWRQSTVTYMFMYTTRNSQPKYINDTSPILSYRGTSMKIAFYN